MDRFTQARRLRDELRTHPGGFAVATEKHREVIPTRRLVPFTLTQLALKGYYLTTQLEKPTGDEIGTMLILASMETAA